MLTAADVMTSAVITVKPETSIHEIAKLLCDHHISGVPVIDDEERLLGIVSEGDLIGHAQLAGEQRRSWWQTFLNDPTVLAQHYAKSHGRTASDVMTKDVVTVLETTSVADTARTLEQHRIKRVPGVAGREARRHRDQKQPASGAGDRRRIEADERCRPHHPGAAER